LFCTNYYHHFLQLVISANPPLLDSLHGAQLTANVVRIAHINRGEVLEATGEEVWSNIGITLEREVLAINAELIKLERPSVFSDGETPLNGETVTAFEILVTGKVGRNGVDGDSDLFPNNAGEVEGFLFGGGSRSLWRL